MPLSPLSSSVSGDPPAAGAPFSGDPRSPTPMSSPTTAKLLCSFGGEFLNNPGRAFYVGGKTRLVSIDRSTTFLPLLSKMSEICNADPSSIDVRFQLADAALGNDFRLVSVETDDDVRNMMEEFDPGRKIPIFLFTAKDPIRLGYKDRGIVEEEEEEEEAVECRIDPDDYVADTEAGTSMSREAFRRESELPAVGHEYENVQAFRNALTSVAIATSFELHMIRSDQRRVTARCAAEGCTWRVHASKLPQASTFRIRTLATEHTCVRSEDAGHRQATAKWIANCIRDKLRQNRNYKPREILNDIHREYGVLITYKRAFLGREKALEELRAEPMRDMVPVESYESITEDNQSDALAWGEIHDPPRKKRVYQTHHPKDVRPLHCTRCNQIGHNRRTCTMSEPYLGGTG